MKKVLFILPAVRSGGSATSMLNLLGLLKERGYEADLFLFQREGCFLERAERVAHVLPEEKIISSVMCPKKQLKSKGLISLLIRMTFVLCHIICGKEKAVELFFRASAKKHSEKYDTVIAYQESLSTDYAQYIECKKRIAWVHSDYHRFAIGKSVEQEQKLYNQYDEIVCVSQVSQNSMLENLHLSASHVHLIYNTIPREFIINQSKEEVEFLIKRTYTFISMGRFTSEKGFDRAIEVAFRLKNEGVDFIWYIIGDGEDFATIKDRIVEKKLEDYLLLLGLKSNPFPYIRQADCFVMTSRCEAQPMVINEALTLDIPVISTRFSSVEEVIKDGVTGFINDNDEDGIYSGILRYISDDDARNKIKAGAKEFSYANDEIENTVISLL